MATQPISDVRAKPEAEASWLPMIVIALAQILMMGSIIAAYAGDQDAARRAKQIGALILAHEGVALARRRRVPPAD